MGVRKKESADKRKEVLKTTAIARLMNCPSSPRKMRTVADLIRGKEVFAAMNILKFNAKQPALPMEKLLQTAIANWEAKTGEKIDEGKAFIKNVQVDSARMMKRLRPAPQGRGYRIRKRSNHVTLILDAIPAKQEAAATTVEATTTETK